MTRLSYEDVLKPGYFQEKPKLRIAGQARPHLRNTTASAIELAQWLSANGIESLVAPKTPTTAAVVQITAHDLGDSALVWPSDWVLLQKLPDGGFIPRVLKESELIFEYEREGD